MALLILVLASRPHARRSTLIAQSRVTATTHAPPDIERLQRLAAGGGVEGFSARSRLEEWKFESMEPALPEKIARHWRRAAAAFEEYQSHFHQTGGAIDARSKECLAIAAAELEELTKFNLGAERDFMLHGRRQDVYAPLCRGGDSDARHAAAAADACIQRAIAPKGTNAFAVDEASEATCWNAAICSAIMYYRRAGDHERAEATLRLARQHPHASTKYDRVDQTPLVFFPGLTSRPFWPSRHFAAVCALEEAFADPSTRAAIDAELTTLISSGRLQRMMSPFSPLDPGSEEADAAAEGAWSEFALYDGEKWNEAACAAVPLLSGLMRAPEVAAEICQAPVAADVPNVCGTNVVVTVLRLAAGATILPHCGVTNRRLIMQFALRGSEGVTFTVGGEARGYGGDGHAIVFDDSFEHEVEHRGEEDRYVLFAILKHPDVSGE